mgnify:CR=1 FL=1
MSETCTVRPELIEFNKGTDSFLSIVAYPGSNKGFRFTDTSYTTSVLSNIEDGAGLNYSGNLADITADVINGNTLEVPTLNNIQTMHFIDSTCEFFCVGGNITDVGTFCTIPTGSNNAVKITDNNVNMNQTGNITQVNQMSFYEAGATNNLTLSNNNITFGDANGTLDLAVGNVQNVQTLVLKDSTSSMDVSGGTIVNAANMQSTAFNGTTATIADLSLGTNVLESRTGGSVVVEQVVFTDKEMKAATIKALDGETTTTVHQTIFDGASITTRDINVDYLTSRTLDANLKLAANGLGTVDMSSFRVTNVSTPVNETDAANKAYVLQAVSENVQGLKPKKACDYVAFSNDWSSANFGANKYCLRFEPADDNGSSVGELKMYLKFPAGQEQHVMFDGIDVATVGSDALNATFTAAANNQPYVDPLRIMFNGLNTSSYRANATAGVSADFGELTALTGLIMDADTTVNGLNGIWEIQQYTTETHASTTFQVLRMKRGLDMNQTHEIINNAYAYVKYGSVGVKNYGYAVTNSDPLNLVNGLTEDGDGNILELKWVQFNNVNYELAFKRDDSLTYEQMTDKTAFAKGGILMRYAQDDEKSVMANANMLNYDVAHNVLQVKGNLDFGALDSAADAYISVNAAKKVDIMGTEFRSGGNIVTSDIVCNTVTAESDRTLKKNIAPMESGLALCSKLEAVTYNWNWDDKCVHPEYGFIAQQVEEGFPSLVRFNSATGIRSVDYMKITSMLVKAVQELQAEIASLKSA